MTSKTKTDNVREIKPAKQLPVTALPFHLVHAAATCVNGEETPILAHVAVWWGGTVDEHGVPETIVCASCDSVTLIHVCTGAVSGPMELREFTNRAPDLLVPPEILKRTRKDQLWLFGTGPWNGKPRLEVREVQPNGTRDVMLKIGTAELVVGTQNTPSEWPSATATLVPESMHPLNGDPGLTRDAGGAIVPKIRPFALNVGYLTRATDTVDRVVMPLGSPQRGNDRKRAEAVHWIVRYGDTVKPFALTAHVDNVWFHYTQACVRVVDKVA